MNQCVKYSTQPNIVRPESRIRCVGASVGSALARTEWTKLHLQDLGHAVRSMRYQHPVTQLDGYPWAEFSPAYVPPVFKAMVVQGAKQKKRTEAWVS